MRFSLKDKIYVTTPITPHSSPTLSPVWFFSDELHYIGSIDTRTFIGPYHLYHLNEMEHYSSKYMDSSMDLKKEYHQKADIFLISGNLHITNVPQVVKTVLGSCVSIIFYHKLSGTCGITHALYPQEPKGLVMSESRRRSSPFRYVTDSINHLYEKFLALNIPLTQIEVKLFGGSTLNQGYKKSIGEANISKAREILNELNLNVIKEDTGGNRGRSLMISTETGSVIVKMQNTSNGEDILRLH